MLDFLILNNKLKCFNEFLWVQAIRVDFIKLILSCCSISSDRFGEARLFFCSLDGSLGRTYSLVQVYGVLAGDDVGDGGTRLLGRRRLLGLGLGVVFDHFDGFCERKTRISLVCGLCGSGRVGEADASAQQVPSQYSHVGVVKGTEVRETGELVDVVRERLSAD